MTRSGTLVLATFVSLAMAASPTAAHEPPRLVEYLSSAEWTEDELSAEQAATLASIRSDPAALEVRIGQAFPSSVRSAGALSLVLPDPQAAGAPATVSFHDLKMELRSDDDYSAYARDEATGSEVSLVVLGPDVLGTIRHGVDPYTVRPLGGGLTAVYRYDSSRLVERSDGGPGTGEVRSPSFASPKTALAPSNPPAASEGGVAVIDVLFVYTRQARVESGSVAALILHAADQVNRIFANSLIRARLRPVYSYQTSYAQQDNVYTDLSRLRSPDDGHMDRVHAVRERYGADFVVLVRGRHRYSCHSTYGHFSYRPDTYAFAAVAQNCIGNYSLAQALGRSLGAGWDYNPDFPRRDFPHGHALCNDPGNWRTLMSRDWSRCPAIQPYFSNPDVSFMGTPTGDAEIRNNAGVMNEVAPVVAAYRQAPPTRRIVPLVPSADNPSYQGFVRVVNRSGREGNVRIHATDDEGNRVDPVVLSLDAGQTIHFNSEDLEIGNPDKGLSAGVGDGAGNWRLELESDLDIEVLAYIRTPDGFLTSMHDVAVHADYGSARYYVPIFNPGRNTDQASRLRLVNLADGPASIRIDGIDDQGNTPPEGFVRLTLPAGEARMLTAEQFEQGAEGLSGQFGAGSGKWQLFIFASQPIQVMSLLSSPTGNLTNLSR